MKSKRTLRDFAPPGTDPKRDLIAATVWFVGLVLLASLLVFYVRYSRARELLYEDVLGRKLLRSGAQIAPLDELLRGTFLPAIAYFFFCLCDIDANLLSFYRESKSIYLMRRVPDRWELPRRCAALPLLALAIGAVLTALCIGLCNLIYFKATPGQCIPAGEHFIFWRAFG